MNRVKINTHRKISTVGLYPKLDRVSISSVIVVVVLHELQDQLWAQWGALLHLLKRSFNLIKDIPRSK